MKHLTVEKAKQLADLAEERHAEYRKRHPGGIVGSGDLKALILERESLEATAFRDAVKNLSEEESRDAVALMYVGRGDYMEGDYSPSTVQETFDGHVKTFSKDSKAELTGILLSKTAVMHRYLDDGIKRVKPTLK
ncbi:DUF3775 domain-containing protein [Pseudomonas mosselii]|uniref:DUF3775 domain-containing protein n=1 Tax=Pseudomonas mosselii TaxID=78327 RepID=A0AA42UTV9_9PSED|nr:DUF3775 domain-containing protein [Pseudomonas mosselii]MDH1632710.1 DUF3775 domain-containing protein [Pseudomonas mosselii]